MQEELNPRPTVDWAEVDDTARLAFHIWTGQPELAWAKRAWQMLTDAKLTAYDNELQRYEVFFRLLALGGIYSDFCDAAWEEHSKLLAITRKRIFLNIRPGGQAELAELEAKVVEVAFG